MRQAVGIPGEGRQHRYTPFAYIVNSLEKDQGLEHLDEANDVKDEAA
jgi:hypothetical protein